jgi:hypothetical protein
MRTLVMTVSAVAFRAAAVALPSPVTSASAQTGRAAPDILKSWPGHWSCIASASDGSAPDRHQLDAIAYGKWLKFSANYTMQNGQQRRFETLFHFDPKTRHWFVLSCGAGGGFIVAKSTTTGNSAAQTFINLYPVDPNQEPGKIVIHASDYSTFDAVKQNGKRVTYHTVCTKIPS